MGQIMNGVDVSIIGNGRREAVSDYKLKNNSYRIISPENVYEILPDHYDVNLSPEQNLLLHAGNLPTHFPIALVNFTLCQVSQGKLSIIPSFGDNVTFAHGNKIISGIVAICHGQLLCEPARDQTDQIIVYLCGTDARAIIPDHFSSAPILVIEAIDGAKTVGFTQSPNVTIGDFNLFRDHINNTDFNNLESIYEYCLLGLTRLFPTLCSIETTISSLGALAKCGHVKTLNLLGYLCFAGTYLPQNWSRAIHYFHIAYLKGDPDSTFMLGEMYSHPLIIDTLFQTVHGHQTGASIAQDYYRDALHRGHPHAHEKIIEPQVNTNNLNLPTLPKRNKNNI